jgi:bifunctional aromatase (cyclase/dehydratase)
MNSIKRGLRALAVVAIASTSPMITAAELKVDDYTAIQMLYARYNTAIDHGDGEAWANTFTADGVFANNFKGHDALVGFVKNWRTNPAMNGTLRRHFSADLVISPSAEGATGTVSTLLVDLSTKPVSIASYVTYSDALVKTADGWRFKTRAIKAEGPPPGAVPGAAPAATAPPKPAGQ